MTCRAACAASKAAKEKKSTEAIFVPIEKQRS